MTTAPISEYSMTKGYKYGAESLTIVPMIFTRPQLVPFIVEFTVIEASPATAVRASGKRLSKLSKELSTVVVLRTPKVWYKLFRIDAAVVEATVVVVAVVVVVVGAAVLVEEEENTERREASVEVDSPLLLLPFSPELSESLTSPGNCCSFANIEDSEVLDAASDSGVASTKSPTVLRTNLFRMFDCGASTFVPSPTFKLALIGSH